MIDSISTNYMSNESLTLLYVILSYIFSGRLKDELGGQTKVSDRLATPHSGRCLGASQGR